MPVNNRWPSSTLIKLIQCARIYRHVGREAFGFDAVEHNQREDNHKARRAFRSEPDLPARPRLMVTRSEIAIHEFGRHRHHDQSENPAHHTTGSKLAPRRAVLKFNLDAIYRSIMETDGVSPDDISRCSLSSLTASAVLARSSFPSSAR